MAIDRSRLDAEPNDPARVLIHDDQDPVDPQTWPTHTGTDRYSRGCLSRGPGKSARSVRRRAASAGSDGRESFEPRPCRWGMWNAKATFCDSRTAPVGITLLHFDDRMNEFCARSLRAGLPTAIRGEQHAILLLAHGFLKAWQCRGLQYDCGTEQTSWTYPERHPTGEDAVRRP